MLLFYQRGDILHFSRSFSIFRQGSYLISLSPNYSPSFPEFSLPFLPLFPSSNPVSSISCAVPEFSPHLTSRTLEKGTFLQSAVTVSSSIASQKLYASSTTAPVIQLLRRSMVVMQAPIIFLSPARREHCYCSTPLRSTLQHYSLLPYCACSPLYNWPPRPLKTSAAFPPHFHILPAMPRIRLRMTCTGFLYSRGIISHLHAKIDYSSILPPEQKWLVDSRHTSPCLLYHSCVSTH